MFTALLKTDISSRATAHSLSTMDISLLPTHISQPKTDIASCEMVISLHQMHFALPTAVTDYSYFLLNSCNSWLGGVLNNPRFKTILSRKPLHSLLLLFVDLEAHPALGRMGFWHRDHLNRKLVINTPLLRQNHLADILEQKDHFIFRHRGSLWPDSSTPPAYGRETGKNGNPR